MVRVFLGPLKRTSWGSTFESTYSKCHVNICIWKGWKRMKRGEWVFSEVFDVFINIVDDNRTLVPFTPSIHHKKHFFLGKFKSIVRLISILGTRWKELISAWFNCKKMQADNPNDPTNHFIEIWLNENVKIFKNFKIFQILKKLKLN